MKSFPHSDEYAHFIAELRALRDETGLTQGDVAAQIGVERSVVTKAEGGVRRIDVIELRAWLRALGTDVPSFMDRLEARLARHSKAGQTRAPGKR